MPDSGAANEARALVARSTVGTLATVTAEGAPWASLVTYGTMGDGSPVLLLSSLAEHGRNLAADPRAALLVAEPDDIEGRLVRHGDASVVPRRPTDPLQRGRVTLSGRAVTPEGARAEAAAAAHLAAVPTAEQFIAFGDFMLYVLHVERVRWVGDFGRMGSCDAAAYAAAAPDGGTA